MHLNVQNLIMMQQENSVTYFKTVFSSLLGYTALFKQTKTTTKDPTLMLLVITCSNGRLKFRTLSNHITSTTSFYLHTKV